MLRLFLTMENPNWAILIAYYVFVFNHVLYYMQKYFTLQIIFVLYLNLVNTKGEVKWKDG